MGRPDGRIEKGQRLNRAISARAWNRAQDAADVVLGVRPGFEAGPGLPYPSQLRFPVNIQGGTTFPYTVIGVRTNSPPPALWTQSLSTPYTQQPPHGQQDSLPSWVYGWPHQQGFPADGFWCICDSVVPNGAVAMCIVRGITFARVRIRSSGHRFAVPSINRDGQPWTAALNGILDSTECDCDGAAKILTFGAIGSSSENQVRWCMVML